MEAANRHRRNNIILLTFGAIAPPAIGGFTTTISEVVDALDNPASVRFCNKKYVQTFL